MQDSALQPLAFSHKTFGMVFFKERLAQAEQSGSSFHSPLPSLCPLQKNAV